jgi:hypothetical protein
MDNKKMKKVLLYFLFIDVRTSMQIYTNFYVLISHNKKRMKGYVAVRLPNGWP